MRYLLNLLYLVILSLVGLCALVPRLRRMDVLTGFVSKFLGRAPQQRSDQSVVWFHAVSVGEALLCRPILDGLRRIDSDLMFVMSVSTPDGLSIAVREYPGIQVFYAPYDFTWSVRRACRAINPTLFIIAENDLWPNLIREVGARGVPVAVFNTRMSSREQVEHRWNGWLIRPALRYVRWWGVVTQQDADWIARLFRIHAPPVEVTGSLKFDGLLRDRNNPQTLELKKSWHITESDRVLVAGSTHAPEETMVLGIFVQLRKSWPELKLILVPRNAERFDEVEKLLERENVRYFRSSAIPRLSAQAESITRDNNVILVDTVGQLRHIWGLADMAFVGGSLCPEGGHNMIEPASYGIPVCFGPHIETFQTVVDIFLSANAAVMTESPHALQSTLESWLSAPAAAAEMGVRARVVVEQHAHSVQTTLERIDALLPRNPVYT
jgi:3-deoxy-D-manno-octulosonic-acid transferase